MDDQKLHTLKKNVKLRPDEHCYNNLIQDKNGNTRGKFDVKTGKVVRGNITKKKG